MDIFTEDAEFTDMRMMQRVVDMFHRRPPIQRIIGFSLLGMEYNDDEPDLSSDVEIEQWLQIYRETQGNHRTSNHFLTLPPLPDHDLSHLPSVKVQAKESNAERKARSLQESKKSKEKAEKKRLKKQKQKERKRLEKLEKEKENPVKEEEDNLSQSKEDRSKPIHDQSKDSSSVKELALGKDTDSSDSSADESSDEENDNKNDSGDSEELDLTSTFVSKAAQIAKRKMEQKRRAERREKKKIPVKDEAKTTPEKLIEYQEVEKKMRHCSLDSASPSPDVENNIKISTQLALIGNKFASAGEFSRAVKYFTDAIKYNPTEFKLFGNRAFCFEKMQEYEKALTDAELSLSMCPGWAKGFFRKGRALAGQKRYAEAADAFREVLKLNSSCTEAAQELMRVQIIQLMEYGFSREQSSNALIIHGTVSKALEVLSKLNHRPGPFQNSILPPAQVANATGVSPVLSAKTNPTAPHPPQSQDAPKPPLKNTPLAPVQNVHTQPKPIPNKTTKTSNEESPPELFPVWVGNLAYPVTETMISNLFNEAGVVYSVKLLIYKRCAFVNFTKPEYCDEAIRLFHGFELKGIRLAVRYPDRIPPGMGISKSALKADENMGQNQYVEGRSWKPIRPYQYVPNYRGIHKY